MRGVPRRLRPPAARAGAELRRLRADQRLVPVVAAESSAISVRPAYQQTGITYAGGRADRYIRYDTLDALGPGHDAHAAAGRHDHVVAGLVAVDPHRRAWGRNLAAARPHFSGGRSAPSVVPSIALYINGVQQCSATSRPAPWSTRSPASPAARPPSSRARVGRRSIATTVRCRERARWRGASSSYSVEAGFVRRRFSVRSFERTRQPHRAVMASDAPMPGAAESAPGVYKATIVTRDALGRNIATTVPLYVDTRLLARAHVGGGGLRAAAVQRAFVRLRPRAGRQRIGPLWPG